MRTTGPRMVLAGLLAAMWAAGQAGAVGQTDTEAGPQPPHPPFTLTRQHESLYFLNDFRLPWPVYQFQTGDINGDGLPEALVGVVKGTRYYPEQGRRLFIFHLMGSKARPLWMGSRLGGTLVDFRFVDGRVRSLETTADGRYVVAEYRWQDFGMVFERFLITNTDKETAFKHFQL